MGCCNSNLHKSNHIEILVEERLIEAAEKQLFFTNKKVEDLLSSIEAIDFSLDHSNFPTLCNHFHIQSSSPSGVFLHNLIQQKLLTVRVLRHLSIILSGLKSFDKFSLIFSLDKKVFLNTIQEILRLSIEVIPNNLENLEKSALAYVESLKPVAEEYIKELRRLSIEEIKDKIHELDINSKDLRIKMYFDLQNLKRTELLDSKLVNLGHQYSEMVYEKSVKDKICEEKNYEGIEEGKVDVGEFLDEKNGEETGKNEEFEEKIEENAENLEEKVEEIEENDKKSDENDKKIEVNYEKIEENYEKIEGLENNSDKTKENHKETEESHQKEPKIPTDSDSSYIKKIPESPDHLSLTEDSLIMPISDQSQEKIQIPIEENLLEDPKSEETDLNDPVPIPVSTNSPKKEENKVESKIPIRKSSGLAAKLKATQALIRSSTLGEKDSNEIKIGLSNSHKNIAFDKIKKGIKTGYSKEEFSVSSPILVDPDLAESSLLRSAQGKINSPSKNSKIGFIRGKK